MGHPSPDILERFASGQMASAEVTQLQEHLHGCADCRTRVEERAAAWSGDTISGEWKAPRHTAGEGAAAAVPGQEVSVGTLVGRYVVIGHLGQGAMGLVLGAYNPRLERKVAIKLLRPEVVGSAALRTRLVREAKALAQLTHPNVVHVHDVGDFGDSVFLAMDFVEGATLTRWLQTGSWSWREVVPIFVMAGRGLAAAHAAGLVHRDFKPDNVLVGRDGVVRVTDFGVARKVHQSQERAPDDDTVSGASMLIGTPAYMSPEQFEGKTADPRADQFGFCIALYEALYRRRPFAGNTLAELRTATLAGPPRLPTDLRVPRWLQAVVSKGLNPRVEDRFASMDVLLAALERGIQPRRVRTVIGVALALSIATVGVLAAREIGRRKADPCEQARARAERVWGAERKPRLTQALLATGVPFAADTAKLVERKLDGWVKAWPDSYRRACSARADATAATGEGLVRQACLENQLVQLNTLLEVLETTDATTAARVAEAIERQVHFEGCGSVSSLPVEPSDPALREKVHAARAALARTLAVNSVGKVGDASAMLLEVLAMSRGLSMHKEESIVLQRLVVLRRLQGKLDESERFGEEAVRAAEIGRADDQVVLSRADLAWTVIESSGDVVRGRKIFEDARAALIRAGSTPQLEDAVISVEAALLRREHKVDEAMALSRKLIALRTSIYGADSIPAANAWMGLGAAARDKRQYEDALAHNDKALEMMRRVLGARHPNVSVVLNARAAIYGAQNKNAEALPVTEEALSILLQNPGELTISLQVATYNLGLLYRRLKRDPEAILRMEQALAMGEKAGATETTLAADILGGLAETHQNLKQLPQALDAATRAIALKRKLSGPGSRDLSVPLSIRGAIYVEMKRFDEATADLQLALKLLEVPEANPVLREITRYELARAMWIAPAQRAAAVKMVQDVSKFFTAKGPNYADYVAEADGWLRTHPPR